MVVRFAVISRIGLVQMVGTFTPAGDTCEHLCAERDPSGALRHAYSHEWHGNNGVAGHFTRQMKKERLAHRWSLAELGRRTGLDPAWQRKRTGVASRGSSFGSPVLAVRRVHPHQTARRAGDGGQPLSRHNGAALSSRQVSSSPPFGPRPTDCARSRRQWWNGSILADLLDSSGIALFR